MNSLRKFLEEIKFEHTLFALPFAYVAALLAAHGWPSHSMIGAAIEVAPGLVSRSLMA